MAFEGLTEKLNAAFKKLRGKGRLSESDVKEAMDKAFAVTESLAYGGDIRSLDPDTQRKALVATIQNDPYFILFYQQGIDGMQTARSSGELGNRSDRWWFKQVMRADVTVAIPMGYFLRCNAEQTRGIRLR